jgi:hypothetical protein
VTYDLYQGRRYGSVSNVETTAPIALIYKGLFPSISTFETLPKKETPAKEERTDRVEAIGREVPGSDGRGDQPSIMY